jgi:phosphate transport system substrate-binding protein
MKRQSWGVLLILPLILTPLTAGCGQAKTLAQGEEQLQGTITISGAWALYPMMVRWGEEFQKAYPGVKFDISAGGAGKGMADALAGVVDIGMVSREIYPQEIEKGAFWVAVTKDAVFLTVNAKNPVWEDLRQRGVSQETLVGIYVSGEVTTWGQVVGRPEVTDPIHVFTRSDACGAADTWAAYLGQAQEDLLGIGVYGDPGVLEAVIKDPLGIGFNNLNFAFDAQAGEPVAGARVVSIDVNGDGQVDPQEACGDTKQQAIVNVAAGYYPAPPARDLNLVTKGQPTARVKAFVTWILTAGQAYVSEVGYIPLAEEKLLEELQKLDVVD